MHMLEGMESKQPQTWTSIDQNCCVCFVDPGCCLYATLHHDFLIRSHSRLEAVFNDIDIPYPVRQ
jgi:diphthamide biosynthesis methyltransferase